jgi:hypothetical protein
VPEKLANRFTPYRFRGPTQLTSNLWYTKIEEGRRTSGYVQVFGRRDAETIPTLGQPASKNLHICGPCGSPATPESGKNEQMARSRGRSVGCDPEGLSLIRRAVWISPESASGRRSLQAAP